MIIVLDAGALVALERDDRDMWSALKLAVRNDDDVIVPSTALAQAWRGSARQASLARALAHCDVARFDGRARAVGELCGRTKTRDICDAHVALVASEQADFLYTSDRSDLLRLLTACAGKQPQIIRC